MEAAADAEMDALRTSNSDQRIERAAHWHVLQFRTRNRFETCGHYLSAALRRASVSFVDVVEA